MSGSFLDGSVCFGAGQLDQGLITHCTTAHWHTRSLPNVGIVHPVSVVYGYRSDGLCYKRCGLVEKPAPFLNGGNAEKSLAFSVPFPTDI